MQRRSWLASVGSFLGGLVVGEFAPPLSTTTPQSAPVDRRPQFEHMEALTALIGQLIAQTLDAGGTFTDTLGNFRPINIGPNGVTVYGSKNHPSSLTFHDTAFALTDALLARDSSVGGAALAVTPDSTVHADMNFGVYDRKTVGGFPVNGVSLGASNGGTMGFYIAGSFYTAWLGTIVALTKSGVPVDGDFTTGTLDGQAVIDTTNHRAYFRDGGTWRYARIGTSDVVSTPASTTGTAGLKAPHGSAPTSPVDGDIWTTSGGMFVRINGVTKTVTLT